MKSKNLKAEVSRITKTVVERPIAYFTTLESLGKALKKLQNEKEVEDYEIAKRRISISTACINLDTTVITNEAAHKILDVLIEDLKSTISEIKDYKKYNYIS